MRFSQLIYAALLLFSTQPSYALYEAHEWGTFTSLVGSDGITQNGMYHEDEALPSFVHGFGELRNELPAPIPNPGTGHHPPCQDKGCFDLGFLNRNIITQKMETPVIYFYSDQERNVEVNVRFPEGVITETFPGPVRTSPMAGDIKTIANGDTTFSVKVLATQTGAVPYVDANNIYAHARNVGSNLLVSGAEKEKFIFYRGIGRFQPRLMITSQNGGLTLRAPTGFLPQAAFLVHVDEYGRGQMLKLSPFNLQHGTEKFVSPATIADLKSHDLALHTTKSIYAGDDALQTLTDSLVQSGLRKDEALAMVNTWKNGYLKVPGLRLLYILPKNEVEQVLPLQITPAPEMLVRSFVGRIEILLDTEEQKILEAVLESPSTYRPEILGRFAEPILRRVFEVYQKRPNKNPEESSMFVNLIQRASVADTKTTVVH